VNCSMPLWTEVDPRQNQDDHREHYAHEHEHYIGSLPFFSHVNERVWR
jgi:hypothetical protein